MELLNLKNEMYDIKHKISHLLLETKFHDYGNLETVNYDITNPDEQQLMQEFNLITEKLSDIYYRMEYFQHPVDFEDTLTLNSDGRYETTNGRRYYTSGHEIEFFTTKEVLNSHGTFENVGIWVISSVEHNGQGYYIVGYPDVSLQNLRVRVRKTYFG